MIAERVRQKIQEMEFEYLGAKIKTSISAGVSFASHDKLCTGEELIRRADVALYASKRRGRNCSTLYSSKLEA